MADDRPKRREALGTPVEARGLHFLSEVVFVVVFAAAGVERERRLEKRRIAQDELLVDDGARHDVLEKRRPGR